MDKIRPWLFVGTYRDTVNKMHLDQYSIRAMLQLASPVEQEGIAALYLYVEDADPISARHLEQGLKFIRTQKEMGHNVLVACGAGVDRASAFCTAALKEEENLGLLDAFKEVKRLHPESLPQMPVWKSLCVYYGEPISYLEIVRLEKIYGST